MMDTILQKWFPHDEEVLEPVWSNDEERMRQGAASVEEDKAHTSPKSSSVEVVQVRKPM